MRAVLWVLIALSAGCGSALRHDKPEETGLQPVELSALPGFERDRLSEAVIPLTATCQAVARLPDDAPLDLAAIGGTAADWRAFCAALALAKDEAAVRLAIRAHLLPYAPPPQVRGLFTGYYEESLTASRKQGGRFQTPLYGPPRDLVSLKLADFGLGASTLWGRIENGRMTPHRSRSDIRTGGLAGARPIFWVDDPIAAFFAQIQGSARVELDGESVRIGFAGKNGHPYTAIGRELVKENLLATGQVSMQSIRAWLSANPERAAEIMDRNASYVFFELQDGPGPRGSSGAVLTPGRSLAVDRDVIPLGLPIWIDTTLPDGSPYQRLMVAQDTGGGIRGEIRGDIFFGASPDAADLAGRMSQPGRWYLLLPKKRTTFSPKASSPETQAH